MPFRAKYWTLSLSVAALKTLLKKKIQRLGAILELLQNTQISAKNICKKGAG